MLKCTSSAAGGISHLLKPGPATVLSLERKPMTASQPLLYGKPDVSLVAIACQPGLRFDPEAACYAILAVEVRIMGYRELCSRRGGPDDDGD
jgi:hypothetical protein